MTAIAEPYVPPDAPPECHHKDWELGCPRCFYEMKGLAEATVHADINKATVEGSVLMAWHIMLVLKSTERRLIPQMRSLDLQVAALAKAIYANFQSLTTHIVDLIADERRLSQALNETIAFVAETRQLMKQEPQQPPQAETPVAEASAILLTDMK